MTDPTSLLVCGDTHGDPNHLIYLYQMALNENVDAIFQVGDFGYWEHHPDGWSWLDMNSDLAVQNDMPLYWIDGNHENHTMLRRLYGPGGEKHKPTPEGFWEIRPGVYYVPRGCRWVWNGKHLMGLGGAYSVDKESRLEDEWAGEKEVERYRHNAWHLTGKLKFIAEAMDRGEHWLWWPEEELTEEEVDLAIAQDSTPLDILFTHDKPRASNPRWNRKDWLPCYPNQDKIMEVVKALTPKLLVHGHLHFPYQDEIRATGDAFTKVVALHCNPDRAVDANQLWKAGAQRAASWVKISL